MCVGPWYKWRHSSIIICGRNPPGGGGGGGGGSSRSSPREDALSVCFAVVVVVVVAVVVILAYASHTVQLLVMIVAVLILQPVCAATEFAGERRVGVPHVLSVPPREEGGRNYDLWRTRTAARSAALHLTTGCSTCSATSQQITVFRFRTGHLPTACVSTCTATVRRTQLTVHVKQAHNPQTMLCAVLPLIQGSTYTALVPRIVPRFQKAAGAAKRTCCRQPNSSIPSRSFCLFALASVCLPVNANIMAARKYKEAQTQHWPQGLCHACREALAGALKERICRCKTSKFTNAIKPDVARTVPERREVVEGLAFLTTSMDVQAASASHANVWSFSLL